ncbi:UNVERIFIED_CONTAM: hypothetical protein HDU68_011056, partial [Siphonaria sp. JEL0065]
MQETYDFDDFDEFEDFNADELKLLEQIESQSFNPVQNTTYSATQRLQPLQTTGATNINYSHDYASNTGNAPSHPQGKQQTGGMAGAPRGHDEDGMSLA